MLLFLLGCALFTKNQTKTALLEENEEYSAGSATVDNSSPSAFSMAIRGLNGDSKRAFAVGNAFFNDPWVTAPASAEGRDGLGPLFNATSCSSCHFKDGRGTLPKEEEEPKSLLLKIGSGKKLPSGAPEPDPKYGDQLQNRALLNIAPEASISISWIETSGHFADGTTYTLRKPTFNIKDWAYGAPLEDLKISPRIAPPVFGLGLIEAIPAKELMLWADPDDKNKDGISGTANMIRVNNTEHQLGRFGWKAEAPSLEAQIAGAFLQDIGITSPNHPAHSLTEAQETLRALPNGGAPEVSEHKMNRITFYNQTLAVPMRRNWSLPEVLRGKYLFHEAQCAQCHRPTLKTGDTHPIPELRNQVIRPYSDFLLHDMGADLSDDRPSFKASGSEWRTPPLWGIGLIETVNGARHLLHDGRARDLSEAILWHGGEALHSQEAFLRMPLEDRKALISFLESL
ncbi:MAG: thiol oxidoreductase [Proteobacteria bacterium]|nr:thiol oxidoreductase [Pseudomonadota bacterium]